MSTALNEITVTEFIEAVKKAVIESDALKTEFRLLGITNRDLFRTIFALVKQDKNQLSAMLFGIKYGLEIARIRAEKAKSTIN